MAGSGGDVCWVLTFGTEAGLQNYRFGFLPQWLSPIPVLMSSAPTKGAPCFSLHVPDHFILVLVNSSNQIFFPHSVTIS